MREVMRPGYAIGLSCIAAIAGCITPGTTLESPSAGLSPDAEVPIATRVLTWEGYMIAEAGSELPVLFQSPVHLNAPIYKSGFKLNVEDVPKTLEVRVDFKAASMAEVAFSVRVPRNEMEGQWLKYEYNHGGRGTVWHWEGPPCVRIPIEEVAPGVWHIRSQARYGADVKVTFTILAVGGLVSIQEVAGAQAADTEDLQQTTEPFETGHWLPCDLLDGHTTHEPESSPSTQSTWNIHTFSDGYADASLAVSGNHVFVVAATAKSPNVTERETVANKIYRTADAGVNWQKIYPPPPICAPQPAPCPEPTPAEWGGEGDVRAHGSDLIYLGVPYSVTNAIVAISNDLGDSWNPLVAIETAGAPADNPWLYLYPNEAVGDSLSAPYNLLAWFPLAGQGAFSLNGGTVWLPLTPLPKIFAPTALCAATASEAGTAVNDERVPHAEFDDMRAGMHGSWGTDGRLYWVMINDLPINDPEIYICSTGDFGTTWTGTWLKLPESFEFTAPPLVAFDELGTLYIMAGNTLLVSLDNGENFPFVSTLPYSPLVEEPGVAQWFSVKGGFVHAIVFMAAGAGGCASGADCWGYMHAKADSGNPSWGSPEVVALDEGTLLDYVQLILGGDGRPIMGYMVDRNLTVAYRTGVP